MINPSSLFVDLGYSQKFKHGENICGDAFKYKKSNDDARLVAVLSDGLGSGVKANILASMTATMALKFETESEVDVLHTAEIMMDALPICQVRKISYATFTIVNAGLNGNIRVIEMGNPEFIMLRKGEAIHIPSKKIDSPKWENRTMRVYDFSVETDDRLVIYSDGITQAGIGSRDYPLGWRVRGCADFICRLSRERPGVSAHELAEEILREAIRKEPNLVAGDDMTCAVIYFREPRKMLLFTGPPFDRRQDGMCAEMLANFEGSRVICGGTSAEIISRELKRPLDMDLSQVRGDIPPMSKMAGVDLVTEGIFTLTRTAQYLENYDGVHYDNPAGKLVDILLNNDIIDVLVGTRINEAHQDPNLPLDLELRRSIVKRLARVLEKNFLKKINIRYV